MHTKRRPNGGMNNGGNGGQHRSHNNHSNNRPRRFNNNRPQGASDDAASVSRIRRGAVQNREKFQMMARDAMSMGDRVLAENYLQHAEHYHRVLAELPPEEAPRPQYLRGFNPETGQHEGQQAGGQAVHTGPQQHAQNEPSHQEDGHQHSGQHIEQPSPHALPSFITQPNQNPPEGSHEE